jgi:hypothetical protein
MNDPHDLNRTVDHSSAAPDALDVGLGAGFGPPRSSLGEMRPVLLKKAEGDSAHVVQPHSDAMPLPARSGDPHRQAPGPALRQGPAR